MLPTQEIFRVRRRYNQWVANQTLEDYALRFTAKSARQWGIGRVASTALGTTAFLALEALGATITLQYGMVNAVSAMIVVCVVIFVIGLPICMYAAREGVDIDLLTRGAGFGYLGSTVTSLVYASFTFIFFAIEAAIMAVAVQLLTGLPLHWAYVVCSLVVIPLVTHGFTFISRFQIGSQYPWLILQVVALVLVASHEYESVPGWRKFTGTEGAAQFDVLVFGAATAVLISLVAQLGEQVDYLRFLPKQNAENRRRWRLAVILAGPGWVFVGFIKLMFGSFIAYVMFTGGESAGLAADPTNMYSHAYAYFHDAPQAALVLAGVMVLLSQMKINITNAYAGSIAWSNFFSRLTHSHPGRVVWLVFNVLIALMLMELGIYQVLESVLGVFAVVALAWLATLAMDLGVNRPLGLAPERIEFKRAHLYDINPVGVGAMSIASLTGILAYLGEFGALAQALAHFMTIAVAVVLTPLIAHLTGGRFYLVRTSPELCATTEIHACCICENEYEYEDMAFCPAYSGPICSLCCSLDVRCGDLCKQDAGFGEQIRELLAPLLPTALATGLSAQIGRFIGVFAIAAGCMGGLFVLVFFVLERSGVPTMGVSTALWILYFLLSIVTGVLVWLFLLTTQSRAVAHQESLRQTRRLLNEIEAHKQTDVELQAAKEMAEAASYAKTRYLSGISHEFRTPLQSILGYAQLLRQSDAVQPETKRAINVIHRSGEHLAGLIEGLLDVARIEAGRIELHTEVVPLLDLLNQLQEIFGPIAEAKGVSFCMKIAPNLPGHVRTDPQRLRQILTNLLSNALKFTDNGAVTFEISYGSQVAEFIVTDTGVGIAEEDLESIFRPFERGTVRDSDARVGTGLGLTIVRLLCDVMGGDISVVSRIGRGSTFRVVMYLSAAQAPSLIDDESSGVKGYVGPRRRVMVVDDDPVQRGLVADILLPLGFDVVEARDAADCMRKNVETETDLFLLDVSMPEVSGIELAARLRQQGCTAPIVMISANADIPKSEVVQPYDHYLVKPIRLSGLLETLGQMLDLEWLEATPQRTTAVALEGEVKAVLRHHAEIGFASGLREALGRYVAQGRIPEGIAEQMHAHIDCIEFDEVLRMVGEAEA